MLKKPDPYVTVQLKNSSEIKATTSFDLSTLNPTWDSDFIFFVTSLNDALLINMYNYDNDKELMDEVEFPLNSLTINGPVQKKEIEITRNKKIAGKLYFKIQISKIDKISDIKPFCTFSATGEKFINQKYYYCNTCSLTAKECLGICEVCAKTCHKDHDVHIADYENIVSFCDCPGKCRCHCMPETNDLQCTSIETNGKRISQPMYCCNDCDDSGKLHICQNCAMKFHCGHKLTYLGIVDAKVCQNGDIKPF